eukprot:TRINITY_DN6980_c0_g1_i1.p1 TRINITY_DN6980_c0_g1~~TRINITY_DN6980_c0_g1_i1.p1  ORF type:complete len:691 (+),score=90.34 TRINITY_DN6980_c0_g1_i1:238-2073(+)
MGRVSMMLMCMLFEIEGNFGEAVMSLIMMTLSLSWLDIMTGKWPIFTLLSMLAEWSRLPVSRTKHAFSFGKARVFMTPWKNLSTAQPIRVDDETSLCDRYEFGALRATRRHISRRWRRQGVAPDSDAHEQRLIANSSRETAELVTTCSFGRVIALLLGAFRRLDGNASPGLALSGIGDAQEAVSSDVLRTSESWVAAELWTTEWPVWEVLARIQSRIELLGSSSYGSAPQQPWTASLQRVLEFDDDMWRLFVDDLSLMASEASSNVIRIRERDGENRVIPEMLRRHARCGSGPQCSKEFFARFLLLLKKSGRFPVRDPLGIGPEDLLAYLHLRGDRTDDWLATPVEDWFAPNARRKPVGSLKEQLDQLVPVEHPLQVDRRQLAAFVLETRSFIGESTRLERCLEWDSPFLLVHGFGDMCHAIDAYTYSEPDGVNPNMGLPGRQEYRKHGSWMYWGDLNHPDRSGLDADTFELIICPFVFEHLSRPFVAMRSLARALRPGGFLLWAAPMFQQYHGVPHDFFRYTPQGARALAEDANLEVSKMYAPGNLGLVSGVMLGLSLPYWSESEVLAEEPEPLESSSSSSSALPKAPFSPQHPLNVFALLRRPPSPERR